MMSGGVRESDRESDRESEPVSRQGECIRGLVATEERVNIDTVPPFLGEFSGVGGGETVWLRTCSCSTVCPRLVQRTMLLDTNSSTSKKR